MKDNSGTRHPFVNSSTTFGTLPELNLQQSYNSLLERKEANLSNFENFLKTKLEHSESLGSRSPQRNAKASARVLTKNLFSTSNLMLLPTTISSKKTLGTIATYRLPRHSNANSPEGKESKHWSPKEGNSPLIKSAREKTASSRLLQGSRQEKDERWLFSSTGGTKETRDKETAQIQALFIKKDKGEHSERGSKTLRESTTRSPLIPEARLNTEQNTSAYSLEKLEIENDDDNKSPFQSDGSRSPGFDQADKKVFKLNLSRQLPKLSELTSIEEIQEEPKKLELLKPKKITSLIKITKAADIDTNFRSSKTLNRLGDDLSARSKMKEGRSATYIPENASPDSYDDRHSMSPDTFKRKSRAAYNQTRATFTSTMTEISHLDIKRNSKRGAQTLVNSYLPDWLTTRYDFKKAIENKDDNARKFIINVCRKVPIDRTGEEIEFVARWLQKIKIFKNLSFQLLESIASKVTYRLYNKDEVLCFQGEVGDCLYIIYDGVVRCVVNRNDVAVFKTYDAPGQKALETLGPRTATLIAAVPTTVLKLERDDYCNIMEFYINKQKSEHLALLEEVDILKNLTTAKKESLVTRLQSKIYSAGEIIYNEGEAAESFYILKSGQLQIETSVDVEKGNLWPISAGIWERSQVARSMKYKDVIEPKQYFGEMELINKCTRIHKVTCLQNSNILIMNKKDFIDMFDSRDHTNFRIAFERHILQDQELMRRKLVEKEAEKKKLRDVVVPVLTQQLLGNSKQPKRQGSIESSINRFKNDYKNFIQENIVGKPVKKSDLVTVTAKPK